MTKGRRGDDEVSEPDPDQVHNEHRLTPNLATTSSISPWGSDGAHTLTHLPPPASHLTFPPSPPPLQTPTQPSPPSLPPTSALPTLPTLQFHFPLVSRACISPYTSTPPPALPSNLHTFPPVHLHPSSFLASPAPTQILTYSSLEHPDILITPLTSASLTYSSTSPGVLSDMTAWSSWLLSFSMYDP